MNTFIIYKGINNYIIIMNHWVLGFWLDPICYGALFTILSLFKKTIYYYCILLTC